MFWLHWSQRKRHCCRPSYSPPTILKFQPKILGNEAIACFAVSDACRVVATKAFTFGLCQGFPPTIEMVVHFCVWVDIGSRRVCKQSAHWFPIVPSWSFPWVLVVSDALIDHCLKCGRCEGVTAETKFLYYRLVARPKLPQHESNLESQVDCDAPHLQRCKGMGEARLQSYHQFVCQLSDAN